jgi:hypothetical protein
MAENYDYKLQLARMERIAELLVAHANKKDIHYNSSWRMRSGNQAFAVISRKWDRFEAAAKLRDYDIFELFKTDTRKESALDDILDLMGYGFVMLEYLLEIGVINDQDIFDVCGSSGLKPPEAVDPKIMQKFLSKNTEPRGFDPELDIPLEKEEDK